MTRESQGPKPPISSMKFDGVTLYISRASGLDLEHSCRVAGPRTMRLASFIVNVATQISCREPDKRAEIEKFAAVLIGACAQCRAIMLSSPLPALALSELTIEAAVKAVRTHWKLGGGDIGLLLPPIPMAPLPDPESEL